jgi:RimJ/RimL family protein N-acetyltransferase
MEPILETDRLVIRRLSEADIDALVALDSDPQVTFFITGGVPDAWGKGYATEGLSTVTSNTPSPGPNGRWIANGMSSDDHGQPGFT